MQFFLSFYLLSSILLSVKWSDNKFPPPNLFIFHQLSQRHFRA